MGKTERETASVMRKLLAELDAGRLDAPGRAGRRLRNRIEGAIAALDPTTEKPSRERG